MDRIRIDTARDALIIVDVQNDFCPGGALAVPDGDKIIPVINFLQPYFRSVVATQDWHPGNHISFRDQGGSWPAHCVAGTKGAEFHPVLRISGATTIRKGSDPDKEAYSGFQGTDLVLMLKSGGINRVFITGLATDYCVMATTLDAIGNGFQAIVVSDAIKGVDVNPGDSEKALIEMQKAGAIVTGSSSLVFGI